MDKAQFLVRMISRAFYDSEQIIVMDALVKHGALSSEDVRNLLPNTGKTHKDAQKIFGKLKEGGLVSMYARQETKANAQKPTTIEYWYIDYRRAIDATKYRVHQVEAHLTEHHKASTLSKDFSCPRCHAEYAELDVLDSPDPLGRGFACKRCGTLLTYNEPDDEALAGGNNILAVFNRQFAPIVNLLKEIDQAIVPEVLPEVVISDRKPVPREKPQIDDGLIKQEPLEPRPFVRPTAVKGVNTGPAKVEVSITTEADTSVAAADAERHRRERALAQNTLPEWHTHSTISNDITAAGQKEESARREREAESSLLPGATTTDDEEKKPPAPGNEDVAASIYAMLKAEQELEAKKRAEEEEDDDDEDDEDDFEDVDVGAVGNGERNGDGTPQAKRIKLDPSVAGSSAATPNPDDESDADDDEFEDVAV